MSKRSKPARTPGPYETADRETQRWVDRLLAGGSPEGQTLAFKNATVEVMDQAGHDPFVMHMLRRGGLVMLTVKHDGFLAIIPLRGRA